MGFGLPESEEIEYHLILAEERLDEAHLLLEQNFYNGAVSRAYYAMFAAARAALLTREIQVKTHTGLRSAFGNEFIKNGQIDKIYGRMLSRGEHIREEADYGSDKRITKEEAEATVISASSFIQIVKDILHHE